MRSRSPVRWAALLALALPACGHQEEAVATRPASPPLSGETIMPSEMTAQVARLPEPDRAFVRQAAGAHMAAIQLGQLATEKGSSERVRAIGREMSDAHTALQEQLREAARREDVVLPMPRMTASQQKT